MIDFPDSGGMKDNSDKQRGTVIALDVGDVRIGVAISRSWVIAEPLETIKRVGRKQTLNALERIITANSVTHCVVGLPLLEDGQSGEQAEKSRAFARSMARRFPQLTIDLHDERYSSRDATEIAGERVRGGENRGLVDRLAAAVILREFLDQLQDREKKSEKKSGAREQDAE